jgi:hypothetical protein
VQVSNYKLDLSLSESDIGKVKVGQPATVTVNAASGEQFAAHVTDIGVLPSSSSSGSSGAVSYPVTLTFDQVGTKLKTGMSASADIVTSQVSGLAVPNQALTGSTVTVVKGGTQTTQTVQTGVVGNSTTQIVAGLQAGDQVLVRSASAAAGASATGASGATGANGPGAGRFGGGGGLGGGGAAIPGGGGLFRRGGG